MWLDTPEAGTVRGKIRAVSLPRNPIARRASRWRNLIYICSPLRQDVSQGEHGID